MTLQVDRHRQTLSGRKTVSRVIPRRYGPGLKIFAILFLAGQTACDARGASLPAAVQAARVYRRSADAPRLASATGNHGVLVSCLTAANRDDSCSGAKGGFAPNERNERNERKKWGKVKIFPDLDGGPAANQDDSRSGENGRSPESIRDGQTTKGSLSFLQHHCSHE